MKNGILGMKNGILGFHEGIFGNSADFGNEGVWGYFGGT